MIKKPTRPFLLRVLVGVLWTPIAAELFLRLFSPVPILPRYIEAGPHGIRANSPDRVYRHKTPDYRVEIRTNAAGLRADQEFSLDKPDGVVRIAILGDSFGMGFGVNIEESSPFQLEKKLEVLEGCEIEILNFSVSGFGAAEELIVLEEEAIQYQPDLVIQYFTPSDPTDDLRSNLFKITAGGLTRASPTYLPAVKVRELLFSYAAYRWLASESHLYSLVRETAGEKTKALLAKLRRLQSLWGPEKTTPEPEKHRGDGAESTLQGAQALTLSLLDRMREIAHSNSAEFLVLSIPRRMARDEFKDGFPRNDPFELPVVTPIPKFRNAGGEMLYWERSDGHWTPLGCSRVAETLFDTIRERRLLPDSCRVD